MLSSGASSMNEGAGSMSVTGAMTETISAIPVNV